MVTASARKPWERLTDETSMAHSWFRCYLHLGADRTLVAVADRFLERKRHKTGTEPARPLTRESVESRIRHWSSDYRWAERARAWDAHIASKKDGAIVKAEEVGAAKLVKMRQRAEEENLAACNAMKIRVFEMLGEPLRQMTKESVSTSEDGHVTVIRQVLEPLKWALRDVAALFRSLYGVESEILYPERHAQMSARGWQADGPLTDEERNSIQPASPEQQAADEARLNAWRKKMLDSVITFPFDKPPGAPDDWGNNSSVLDSFGEGGGRPRFLPVEPEADDAPETRGHGPRPARRPLDLGRSNGDGEF